MLLDVVLVVVVLCELTVPLCEAGLLPVSGAVDCAGGAELSGGML
jgi:hypothetical protein